MKFGLPTTAANFRYHDVKSIFAVFASLLVRFGLLTIAVNFAGLQNAQAADYFSKFY